MRKTTKQIFTIIFTFLLSILSFEASITTLEEAVQAQKTILKMHTVCRSIYPAERIPQKSGRDCSIGDVIDDDIQNLTKTYRKGACRQFSSYYLKFLTQKMNIKATFLWMFVAPKNLNIESITLSDIPLLTIQGKLMGHSAVIYELMPGNYFVIDPSIQDQSSNCLPIEEYFNLLEINFNIILLYYLDDNLYNNSNPTSSLPQCFIFNKFNQPYFKFQPFSF